MKPLLAIAFEGNYTLPLIWQKIIIYSVAKGIKAPSIVFSTKGNSVSNLRTIMSKNIQNGWALEETVNN